MYVADDLRVIGTFHNLIETLVCYEVLLLWTTNAPQMIGRSATHVFSRFLTFVSVHLSSDFFLLVIACCASWIPAR